MKESIRQEMESIAKSFEDAAIKFSLADQAMMYLADMYRKHLPYISEFVFPTESASSTLDQPRSDAALDETR